MKTYRISFKTTDYFIYEVKAKSFSEAIDIARERSATTADFDKHIEGGFDLDEEGCTEWGA